MKRAAVNMINFYRNYISILKLQSCRFYPTCSQYAIESIEKKGLLKGTFFALGRIFRCHPFSKGGHDPVK